MPSVAVRRSVLLTCLTLFLTLIAVSGAFAQAAPPAAPAQPAVPPPPAWHGAFGGGVQWHGAVTDQAGFNLAGGVLRASPVWNQSLEGDVTYMKVKGPGFEQTVADSQNLRYTLQRDLNPRVFLAIRPAFKRNEVQKVDYRFEEIAGVGFRAVQKPKLHVSIVPMAGLVQQEKNIPALNNKTATAGILETITVPISAMSSFDQMFLYQADLRNTDDYRMQFELRLNTQIAGPLGLQVAYLFDRENIVLGGVESADQDLRLSFNYRF